MRAAFAVLLVAFAQSWAGPAQADTKPSEELSTTDEHVASPRPPTTARDYFQILQNSSLTYRIETGTLDDPVEQWTCDRRGDYMRVVTSAEGLSLVAWEVPDKAQRQFERGEKLFQKEQYSSARKYYAKGTELAPDWGPGWLLLGDADYFLRDFERALAEFRHSIALDPTHSNSHWFAADALRHLGRLEEAETELVEAVVRDPGSERAWKVLASLEQSRGLTYKRPSFEPPPMVGNRVGNEVRIVLPNATDEALLAYAACRAVWAHEKGFRARFESGSRSAVRSDEEESCTLAYMNAGFAAEAQRLAESRGVDLEEISVDEVEGSLSGPLQELQSIATMDLLDGYVLVERIGRRCPMSASLLPEDFLDASRSYVRHYVLGRSFEDAPSSEPTQ